MEGEKVSERRVETARSALSAAELGSDFWGVERPTKIDRYLLIPGDPGRVGLMASQWDKAVEYRMERGHRFAQGVYAGVPIGALSSGIGGPSLERMMTQACELGADTFIRVGTTGTLREDIKCGDLIINECSVRLDGTSRMYVREEYPAAASFEVTMALVEACERLGVVYHVGVGATSASFWAGQGRTAFGGYRTSLMSSLIQDLQSANVTNFEMEGATLLTLARLFGFRAGVLCAVLANRVTGEWNREHSGVEQACRVASEAVRILADWDGRKQEAGKPHFFPGLLMRNRE